MPTRLLIALVLLLTLATAQAARDPLDEPSFTMVGDARSISDGVVTALAQDDRGLIWIGTPVGLVRHDGYQLRRVPVGGHPEAAGPGAGSSFVRTLLAAPDGVLWVGLEGEGLARFDARKQTWTRHAPAPQTPGALANGSVRALARDADGVLWVGTTGGGLHSLAPGASQFVRYRHADGELPDDRVQSLCVDRQGTLWVGTWNGLVRRPRGGTHFESVLSDPGEPGSLAGRIVSMLGEAPDGRIWVGSRQGDLLIIDPHGGSVSVVEKGARAQRGGAPPAGSSVLAMAWPNADEVWIGRDDGIDLRAAGDGAVIQRLRRDLRKPWGPAGHNVVALLRDASGLMWAGSYGGGLQRNSPGSGLWVRRGEGGDGQVMAEGDTRSLWQLANGQIWAGMNERGVAVLDQQLRLQAEIRPEPQRPGGFRGGLVGALAQSTDGSIWVGTEGTVYRFNAERRLLGSYAAGEGRARRMLATRDGSVWVGTQDGVYRLAPGAGRFQRQALADGRTLRGNVNALAEAGDGSVWVGGNDGLYRYPVGGQALQAVSSPAGQGLRKSVVLGLLVDRRQVLWVDTNGGLHRMQSFQDGQAVFQRVAGAEQTAGGGSVGANLLDDEQGRIWTHQYVYDPRDGSTYELSLADGVDIGTGWFRSYARLADGRFLFGGSAGILVVRPERFKPWTYEPPLVLSELRVDGERLPPTAELTLGPDRRSFSVEFAALDYTHADRNRYRYRLHGFDADWVETGADLRLASYGNLSPGHYVLQVQGSNRNGQWSPRLLRLDVAVLPAWWQTWWALALAALGLVGVVVGAVEARTALLRRRQTELESKVRERTLELETLSRELQLKSAALEASSLTDPLTGLHNRRFLSLHLEADIAQAVRRHEECVRRGTPVPDDADVVFFVIDIDQFKQVNDQHGHAAGDAVLVQMRTRLQQAFRQADYIVRWGGEEFLIAARAASRAHAGEVAERARAAVADAPFVLEDGTLLHKTCSVGFAAFPVAPQWPGALGWLEAVELADQAMYAVKRSGRDGWLGVLHARAPSAAALREEAALPLAEWAARGGVSFEGSPRCLSHLKGGPNA